MIQLKSNRQQGAVLVTALMLLIILTLLGVTTITTTTMEERMASNIQDVNRAFHTADTGLSILMEGTDTLNTSSTQSGTTSVGTYGASTSYSSSYRQEVPMGRSSVLSQMWEAGKYSKYYFDLSSTGTTSVGTTSSIDGGTFQISQKSN